MSQEATTSSQPSKKPRGFWWFFVVALVLLLLFWGATLLLTGGQAGNAAPEEAARVELRIKNLAELRADNAKKLETYAWIDRAKGSVQIPITEAMKIVAATINDTQPHAAYPVATPAAAPAPSAPAPSTSPAPATP